MKSYIIGIAGKKQSGKDTCAEMINYIFAKGVTKANYEEFILRKIHYKEQYKDRIIHFADPLKECLSIMYNIKLDYFYDTDYKDNKLYNMWTGGFISDDIINRKRPNSIIITIDMLDEKCLADILYINREKIVYIKLRTLLQYYGTNICRRKLKDTIWIDSTINKAIDIANARRVCIIPDVRFDNEAKAIQFNDNSLYGGLIRINRNTNVEEDNHDSETGTFNVDYEINNNISKMSLFYKVLDIVQQIVSK